LRISSPCGGIGKVRSAPESAASVDRRATFLLLLGWFAALFTGRLPVPFASFLSGFLAAYTRVQAYYMLLTDEFPPFAFATRDYPVNVTLAPGRLNRLAVLFRLILAVPAAIVSGAALAGWCLLGFFIWLLVLVTGRVPGALFDATTALVRYYMRYAAYVWMLTSAYPSGLFGDQPSPTEPQEAYQQGAYPGETAWPPPPAPVSGGVFDRTAPAAAPVSTSPQQGLVLSAGARRVMVLFLVLGVMVILGSGVAGAIAASQTSRSTNTAVALTQAHDTLGARLQQFQQQTTACTSGAVTARLSCLQAADDQAADAFEAFATRLDGLTFSSTSSRAAAADLGRVSHDVASALRGLASASSAEEYQQRATGIVQPLSTWDARYQGLANTL